MSKQKLILQPGKTYVTNSGEHITLTSYKGVLPFYTYYCEDNDFYYGDNGRLFENEFQYEEADTSHKDDISYELAQGTVDEPEVHIIDVLKFKQKSNGIKRKLLLKDYSDDSVEIIFKTKFNKDEPQVTTGIRLSYEAILMLYDSLEYMLEENQRTLH